MPGAAHGRGAVGTDRLHRLRRPTRAHRAAPRPVCRTPALAHRARTSRTRSPRATCCPARRRPSSRSSPRGASPAPLGAIVGGVAFIVPGLVLILALAALFLAAAPPTWVLGAGAGAGAAVAAVAVRAGTDLRRDRASRVARPRTRRWVLYALARRHRRGDASDRGSCSCCSAAARRGRDRQRSDAPTGSARTSGRSFADDRDRDARRAARARRGSRSRSARSPTAAGSSSSR